MIKELRVYLNKKSASKSEISQAQRIANFSRADVSFFDRDGAYLFTVSPS